MSEEGKLESLKSLYELCISTRNFEIGQLIQRNNFFMLFQGVLIASVMQAENSKPFVEFIICITGMLVSIYQMQMASGAKYWQEWWESRVEEFEKKLLEELKKENNQEAYELFTVSASSVREVVASRLSRNTNEKFTNFFMLQKYSVGRAPMKVSIVLIATWFVLTLATIQWSSFSWLPEILKGFTVVVHK